MAISTILHTVISSADTVSSGNWLAHTADMFRCRHFKVKMGTLYYVETMRQTSTRRLQYRRPQFTTTNKLMRATNSTERSGNISVLPVQCLRPYCNFGALFPLPLSVCRVSGFQVKQVRKCTQGTKVLPLREARRF